MAAMVDASKTFPFEMVPPMMAALVSGWRFNLPLAVALRATMGFWPISTMP